MILAELDPTLDGWRAVARRLLLRGVEPSLVEWVPRAQGQGCLEIASAEGSASQENRPAPRVPRRFMALAAEVAAHRSPQRWALLYRTLWRLTHGEPRLLEVAVDEDVHRLQRMERAVRRSAHKMKAFVRFRAVEQEGEPRRYVAWFEPEHDVTEQVAPFFAERFASMRWSILTPDRSAHWEGPDLWFTPGLTRSAAPAHDALEELWRTYYASTFNPARVRLRAMRGEMPRKYWKNLPEARLVAPLVQEAPARVRRMIDGDGAEPALLRRGR